MVEFKPKNHVDILYVIENELKIFNKRHSTNFKSVREALVFIHNKKRGIIENKFYPLSDIFEEVTILRKTEKIFMIMYDYLKKKNLE